MVHTHGSGGRRRGKPRSRILYWFRTPPGVRIGRSALDEDAIKLIEQHNPDVDFDWTRILKGQDEVGEPRGGGQQERRNQQPPREVPAPQQVDSVPVEARFQETEFSEPQPADDPVVQQTQSSTDVIDPPEAAVVEEFLIEPRVEPPAPRPQAGDALSAVEARLGAEGLARLRARYSEVLARISETVSDPARQEELKNTAERLNPDTWVTEADVNAGLEDYESVFESLRSVVGRRRRRGRRVDRRRGNANEISPSDSSVPSDEAEPGDEPESAEQQ